MLFIIRTDIFQDQIAAILSHVLAIEITTQKEVSIL
jgi:hypothetical protein